MALVEDPVAVEICNAWQTRITSTQPIDATRAREAVHALYDALGVARPAAVLVVASPRQAVLTLRVLANAGLIGPSDEDPVSGRLASLVAAAPRGGVGAAVRDLAEQITMYPIRATLSDHHLIEADQSDRTAIASIIRSQSSLDITPRLPRVCTAPVTWAALDLAASMAALAQLEFWTNMLSDYVSARPTPVVEALDRVCRTCGWSVLLEKAAVVCDRPAHFDRGTLETAASRVDVIRSYRDGFEMHARQGVLLPAWLVASPHRVTVQHIERERNVEMRRLLLEGMGIERYLKKSKAKKLAQDDTGILWQRILSTSEQEWRPTLQPMTFVEVVNGTPEPDGSFRHYFLRVPPWVRSAREGVAWTYGLGEDEYKPTLRT